MSELAQDPQLHKHIVVRSYLSFFAEKHKCHIDKIMVGMVGGDLHVWKYDEGAANIFTQLEIISNFETDDRKWICQLCGELVNGRNVTFEEYHEGCGGLCV
jgi:hypothetical protein